jgi:hypothetical protein
MLNNKIKKYLNELDKEVCPLHSSLGEHKIAEEIKNILKKEGEGYKPSNEDIAELNKDKWLNTQAFNKLMRKH